MIPASKYRASLIRARPIWRVFLGPVQYVKVLNNDRAVKLSLGEKRTQVDDGSVSTSDVGSHNQRMVGEHA